MDMKHTRTLATRVVFKFLLDDLSAALIQRLSSADFCRYVYEIKAQYKPTASTMSRILGYPLSHLTLLLFDAF